ncbi:MULTISPECIES: Fe(2+) transporter permease subunit FeoB [Limnospira]|uniref:Fe(2+) transporter permease subunit FeoB n=1 Tax=Limnospira TaxID=2596745 RepID=UPI0002804394|nr:MULTISPECIES: Fe(2+) transporter permease subunit FeoB [unclassified Limnospira]EKD06854.1 ferrous iron transport protein B [Arthrospira platensis C1]MDY7054670.1 Fe(2+) transporter permease subunit FeoB [Limnospira fusiformis LS22]MDT9189168.1 Fe(2+) transporter permease subunit FeoB [Limnospira sp. PMC 894.15]MDT9235017.1 Fe(2+) transporter permease subunit FeoB [Limnospira sp. PMC 917.15]UWU48401.1 ferrous iron transport protein B [Arthrospira platensis C1]
MKKPTIALIGNPNCGKTTVFNNLTGSHQTTGNWPGVTVDRKEGYYSYNGQKIAVIDLPGVYSLDAEDSETSLDEKIARDYLLAVRDLIVNVIDASNLERNLYLTTQLIEMGLPVIALLNMMDLAESGGLQINPELLSERLGCPVLQAVAVAGVGTTELRSAIAIALERPPVPKCYVIYPAVVEEAIARLMSGVIEYYGDTHVAPRWTAVKLLEYRDDATPYGAGSALRATTPAHFINPRLTALEKRVVTERRKIHQTLGEDIDIIIADSRYSFVRQLLLGVAQTNSKAGANISDQIDLVVLNRWLGIPIFLTVMYLAFLFTINIGGAFIDFFDIAAGTIFVDGFGVLLENLGWPGWAIALLADGAGGGIQTVTTFIPVIGFMFLFLSFLEDSGYMARAAFVMDRLMRFVGLPGKSFVPMLLGFGCNVPAIMATRTLENPRDRIMTIIMNPFMSCGARLPVYALFAAAFFPVAGQNMVFGLYLIGIAAAIFSGLVLKNTLLRGKSGYLIMELPPYHIPQFNSVLLRTWDRLKAFLLRAGKAIVLMVMVLGLLNSLGTDGSFGNQDSEESVLSATAKAIAPAFAPMGIRQENWPATVGIFTGIFAKEVMVGTLDNIYSQIAQEKSIPASVYSPFEIGFDFWGGIRNAFATIPGNLAEVPGALLDPLGLNISSVQVYDQPASEQPVAIGTFGEMVRQFDGKAGAFAYLLFVLLYFPCVSATAAVYRETNLGWTLFAAGWTTGLAYWVAVMFYQIATFARHPLASTLWIGFLAMVMAGVISVMKASGKKHRKSSGASGS